MLRFLIKIVRIDELNGKSALNFLVNELNLQILSKKKTQKYLQRS